MRAHAHHTFLQIRYQGIVKPYVIVQDHESKTLLRQTALKPAILGATNPIFKDCLETFPNFVNLTKRQYASHTCTPATHSAEMLLNACCATRAK